MAQGIDRRGFLKGTAGLAVGSGLLTACGGSSSSSGAAPLKKASRPPAAKEPGRLSLLEWGGYEATGTKAQTAGLKVAGAAYVKKYGPDTLRYTYITNDDQALQKARSGGPFDVMHPCHENIQDYVDGGLVQPWDTSLLPSFKQLNPYLAKQGQYKGQQYMIPWDWGYGSLTYRTDKVDPKDATGWELAWNPKYAGRISLWSGASTNFEIAALVNGYPKMDDLTAEQLQGAKQKLKEQKPLNKFYWDSEYGQMQPAIKSGTVWIAYSWQDTLVTMKAAKIPVAFLQPSQGRLSWFCGFMLGKQTENFFHAHEYVESFINREASAQMTNAFAYGTSNSAVTPADVTDKALASALRLSNPRAISEGVHLQSWTPQRTKVERAWQEIKSS